MLKKNFLFPLACALTGFLLIACAAQKPLTPFDPYDLNPGLKNGKYTQKTDNFIMVLDASGSMAETYKGQKKVDIAKNIAGRINMTLPQMKLAGALRVIGQSYGPIGRQTKLIYGLTDYSRQGLDQALQTVTFASGGTPLGPSIQGPAGSAVSQDLKSAKGNIAAIVISDGIERDKSAIQAAKNVKAAFGDRLCIYPIVVGDSAQGIKLMEEIARIGECGFAVNADRIYSREDMAAYVENVFLAKAAPKEKKEAKVLDQDKDGVPDNLDRCPDTPRNVTVNRSGCPLDTDGDGVYDYLDKCPGTPAGVIVTSSGCPPDSDADGVYDYLDRCPYTPLRVSVDERGCPPDSDRDGVYDYIDQCPETPSGVSVDNWGCPPDRDADGVYDYKDKCPETPRGATVNQLGCWELVGLNFDTAKWNIKTAYHALLIQVVEIMNKNPTLKIEIQGHTDNIGAAKYNQQLSEKRANAVKEFLIEAGVQSDRIRAKGYGLSQPIASNETEQGRKRNRRVELKPIW